jgi:hypothetical protein
MFLSRWRQIRRFEAVLIAAFFVAGSGILFTSFLPTIDRNGIAIALLIGGASLIYGTDAELQQREWLHFRRRLAAFFSGYGVASLTTADHSSPYQAIARYRERTKQLLLLLGLSDPSLMRLIDELASSSEEKRQELFEELSTRAKYLLTKNEKPYFTLWYFYSAALIMAIGQTTQGTSPPEFAIYTRETKRHLDENVAEIVADKNPFVAQKALDAVSRVIGMLELPVSNRQKLLSNIVMIVEEELAKSWDRLVTGID